MATSPMSPTAPGTVGWPLVGDKSYEFYKNPRDFLNKYMTQNKSRVFSVRFLNKPTVFVCSNSGVEKVLADGGEHLELGYKAFMGQIFGDNILFTNGEEAQVLRQSLSQLFTEDSVRTYHQTIDRVLNKKLASMDISQPKCLYAFFKQLVTEICLSLFLGLDFQDAQEVSDTIISMTTTHWHGIISVPLPLKIPGRGGASSYSKALDAKKKLLEIIKERRVKTDKSFPQHISTIAHDPAVQNDTFVNNHLLLFTSALVPKALASILTSFAVEVGQKDKLSWQTECLSNPDFMDAIFLEVQRLYPAFLGGRRIVTQDYEIDGYLVPKDHAVVFMTFAAHRDPAVFEAPEEFRPERWTNCSADMKSKLFCFGAGPRGCLGQRLVWDIIKSTVNKVMGAYQWRLHDNQELSQKWLPVSRPKGEILATFTKRDQ
ncbi:cytochrome P450 716B1-like [Haliotis rufescens]|uniref:cytochrome P450 716B1-like n=1 Tax=Haliotis rufescens TaxID=6454 RepID=UPI00201F737B|nr:cytochrome P450 716B1-like [Haliotis rufescens]